MYYKFNQKLLIMGFWFNLKLDSRPTQLKIDENGELLAYDDY